MNDGRFNAGKTYLKANQIACLEYNQVRLYGEVIQLIPQRQICWFRPIYLLDSRFKQASLGNNFSETGTKVSPPSNLAAQSEIVPPDNDEQIGRAESSWHSESWSKTYSAKILTTELPETLAISSNWNDSKLIVDLRASSDLLWPETLFRPALDTEVIDFLAQLSEIDHITSNRIFAQKYLNDFLQEVWQFHQDKF